jgi:hypothetical protein
MLVGEVNPGAHVGLIATGCHTSHYTAPLN